MPDYPGRASRYRSGCVSCSHAGTDLCASCFINEYRYIGFDAGAYRIDTHWGVSTRM